MGEGSEVHWWLAWVLAVFLVGVTLFVCLAPAHLPPSPPFISFVFHLCQHVEVESAFDTLKLNLNLNNMTLNLNAIHAKFSVPLVWCDAVYLGCAWFTGVLVPEVWEGWMVW